MKALDVQNHYQVLEVSPGAPPEEIDRAYRLAEATWAEAGLPDGRTVTWVGQGSGTGGGM